MVFARLEPEGEAPPATNTKSVAVAKQRPVPEVVVHEVEKRTEDEVEKPVAPVVEEESREDVEEDARAESPAFVSPLTWLDISSWFGTEEPTNVPTPETDKSAESNVETRQTPDLKKEESKKAPAAVSLGALKPVEKVDAVKPVEAKDVVKASDNVEAAPRSSPVVLSEGVAPGCAVEPVLPNWLAWLDPVPQTSSGPVSAAARELPVVAAVDESAERNDDDDSINEKVFPDLASLPSVNGSVAASAVHTVDMSVLQPSVKKSKNPRSVENVQSVVESKLKQMDVIAPVNEAKTDAKSSLTKSEIQTRRQLLVKELRSAINEHGRYDISVANVSVALGDLMDEAQDYEQAIKLYRDAISILSTKLGDDHSTTMETRTTFGTILEHAKLYEEAIQTFYLVTVMQRALHGEKEAADSLVHIARVLRKKEDYAQSIKELKRALKIYRETLGDAHVKVSDTVDEIASLYVTIGDFDKSAAILEEVVKLKAATMGMKSKEVAETLISLATTYECSEEFTKSMKALKKAYKIYTEIGGYSSEDSTSTLNKIAQLYDATGDHNRASIAYLGVLRGRKINYGNSNLKVGETYFKLGRSLRETGQVEKALKCMKEALPIYVGKGVEMGDVEMIAEIMHEMAILNKEKKFYNEAARIFKQELGVRRKIGQSEYPMIAKTLNHMGIVEFEMKNNTRALKYLVEALTIYQKNGEKSVDCAEVLFNSGLVFEATSNKDRALEAFDEAANIFKAHGYKDNHPHIVKARCKIEKIQQAKNGARK